MLVEATVETLEVEGRLVALDTEATLRALALAPEAEAAFVGLLEGKPASLEAAATPDALEEVEGLGEAEASGVIKTALENTSSIRGIRFLNIDTLFLPAFVRQVIINRITSLPWLAS